MNTCSNNQDLMLEYVYGLLDEPDSRDLQAHAASCTSCATALREARSQQGRLAKAAKREFPEVRFVAPADVRPATQPLGRLVPAPRWVIYATAASVLIAGGVTLGVIRPWKADDGGTVAQGNPGDPTKIHPSSIVKPNETVDAGKEVDGLQASIRLEKKEFHLSNPDVKVIYHVKNTSKEPRVIWRRDPQFWVNHEIIVRDENGADVPRTVRGQKDKEQFAPAGPRDPSSRVELAGSSVDTFYDFHPLPLFFRFEKPGKYTVQIIYEERHPDGWQGRLESNVETFHIVP